MLTYLSRYTHRVAIANRRLLFVGDGMVRFAYRDYADHHQRKEMPLPAAEFLRRFLQHVVPTGFMRIRHYGGTANCHRQQKLARCRELLAPPQPAPPATPTAGADPGTHSPVGSDADAPRCPSCGGPLRVIERLAPTAAPYDTS